MGIKIKATVQNLVLDEAGEIPTLPSPLTLTPKDVGFKNTDLVEGQLAYNNVDNIWYFRKGAELKNLGNAGIIVLTQEEYDLISTPDSDTIYIISDAEEINLTIDGGQDDEPYSIPTILIDGGEF